MSLEPNGDAPALNGDAPALNRDAPVLPAGTTGGWPSFNTPINLREFDFGKGDDRQQSEEFIRLLTEMIVAQARATYATLADAGKYAPFSEIAGKPPREQLRFLQTNEQVATLLADPEFGTPTRLEVQRVLHDNLTARLSLYSNLDTNTVNAAQAAFISTLESGTPAEAYQAAAATFTGGTNADFLMQQILTHDPNSYRYQEAASILQTQGIGIQLSGNGAPSTPVTITLNAPSVFEENSENSYFSVKLTDGTPAADGEPKFHISGNYTSDSLDAIRQYNALAAPLRTIAGQNRYDALKELSESEPAPGGLQPEGRAQIFADENAMKMQVARYLREQATEILKGTREDGAGPSNRDYLTATAMLAQATMLRLEAIGVNTSQDLSYAATKAQYDAAIENLTNPGELQLDEDQSVSFNHATLIPLADAKAITTARAAAAVVVQQLSGQAASMAQLAGDKASEVDNNTALAFTRDYRDGTIASTTALNDGDWRNDRAQLQADYDACKEYIKQARASRNSELIEIATMLETRMTRMYGSNGEKLQGEEALILSSAHAQLAALRGHQVNLAAMTGEGKEFTITDGVEGGKSVTVTVGENGVLRTDGRIDLREAMISRIVRLSALEETFAGDAHAADGAIRTRGSGSERRDTLRLAESLEVKDVTGETVQLTPAYQAATNQVKGLEIK